MEVGDEMTSDSPERTTEPGAIDGDELSLGQRVGPYLIVECLGQGGMGQVFLGTDVRLHRKVALKSLLSRTQVPGDQRARVLREARAAAQINHPNVATIHDIIEHHARTLIVMEYVEGESLARVMRRQRLTVRRVVAIGRQLAAALTAAHAKGVIHRDLKPANIQMTTGGLVKVLDFGVAAATAAFTTVSGAGEDGGRGAQPGTLGYMSPEQMLSRHVDERSDTFGLGLVLFEMATGERAFRSTDTLELVEAVAQPVRRADAVDPHVPRELADLIATALDIEPSRRYQSAAELGAALEALDVDHTQTAVPATLPTVPRRWSRTRATPIALGAVLIALVASAVMFVSSTADLTARTVAVLPFEGPGVTDADHLVAGVQADVIRELQRFDLRRQARGRARDPERGPGHAAGR